VIDAGWYVLDASSPPGGANADDWMVRVGDYRPDPSRFPNGLGLVFELLDAPPRRWQLALELR
jgi:hypothetical protein